MRSLGTADRLQGGTRRSGRVEPLGERGDDLRGLERPVLVERFPCRRVYCLQLRPEGTGG